jgi:hypothetical protein
MGFVENLVFSTKDKTHIDGGDSASAKNLKVLLVLLRRISKIPDGNLLHITPVSGRVCCPPGPPLRFAMMCVLPSRELSLYGGCPHQQ